ncbi:MAG: HAD family hydrolase [Bacteroidales bacterium]
MMKHSETNLRNIIFDLGGVLIDLDISRTGSAFSALGISEPSNETEILSRSAIYSGLETGEVSPRDFRNAIRDISTDVLPDTAIDNAWNAMLLDFPATRKDLLLQLGKNYRLFLLSNSNVIHYQFYTERFRRAYGFEMDSLFEKAYYSFEMHLHKPEQDIFLKLLADSSLHANKTLFIDDSLENIKTAATLGFTVHQIVNGEDVTHLFTDGIWVG